MKPTDAAGMEWHLYDQDKFACRTYWYLRGVRELLDDPKTPADLRAGLEDIKVRAWGLLSEAQQDMVRAVRKAACS